MPEEGFGTRVRLLRKQHNLSQVGLACLLNVTKLSVWNWERRGVIPRSATIKALAHIFEVPESELLVAPEHEERATMTATSQAPRFSARWK